VEDLLGIRLAKQRPEGVQVGRVGQWRHHGEFR